MYWNFPWTFNAETNLVASYLDHSNRNLVIDDDGFIALAAEDEDDITYLPWRVILKTQTRLALYGTHSTPRHTAISRRKDCHDGR